MAVLQITCNGKETQVKSPTNTASVVLKVVSKWWWVCAESLQSCLILCDPMNYSPPGSSIHGVLEARILEWAAIPSSRGSSQPRDRTWVSYVSCIGRQLFFSPLVPPTKPYLKKQVHNKSYATECVIWIQKLWHWKKEASRHLLYFS